MDQIDDTIAPQACENMDQVREGVDAVDRALVALLVRRFGYMDAAARIKGTRDAVRDEARKADVLDKVRAKAIEAGLPDGLAPRLWEELIETSIAYEFDRWDDMRG